MNGLTGLEKEQIAYVKTQLAQTHQSGDIHLSSCTDPLWLQKNTGWEKLIETQLGDRDYTVFAGHHHKLTLYDRKG